MKFSWRCSKVLSEVRKGPRLCTKTCGHTARFPTAQVRSVIDKGEIVCFTTSIKAWWVAGS